MKIHAAGLLAWAGLGYAIPHVHHAGHDGHNILHEARYEVHTYTTVVTSTLVQTEPAAIIWVDASGRVISTEYEQPPASTAGIGTAPSPAATSSTGNTVTQASTTASSTASADIEASVVSSFWPSKSTADSKDVDGQSSQTSYGTSGYGIAYDMIGTGPCKDAATIASDVALMSSNGYTLVRTYDIGCDVGILVQAAMNYSMKAFVGINDISNVVQDIETLISYITDADAWAGVDTVNIGNEVVNDGGSAAAVVAAIAVAKPLLQDAGFSGNVVTVDTFAQHLANPSLCAASSYCAVNAQPYFDSTCNSSFAGAWVLNAFKEISAQSGKDTVVTEAGWPYSGSSNGAASASPSDQTNAVDGIKQAFGAMPSNVYIFQGFDATYKSPGSLGIEQFFGIFDH